MRSASRYQLDIELQIREVDDRGYPVNGPGLSIRENLQLRNVESFMELAGVLSRFHELAKEIEMEDAEEPDA